MKIVSTATAFPPHYYLQDEVVQALKTQWQDGLENAAVLERLHSRTGVAGRYFSFPLAEYLPLDTWGKTNDAWIKTAVQLGERAIDCLLTKSGLSRNQPGALFFVSVTGVSSPSVDALLVNRMRLNPQIKRNPIFGLGCVAGAAGLSRAADYVRAYPDQVAILLSIELCSLTWQRDDFSVANIISTGLFGDGAAAVLVAGDKVDLKGPKILGTASSFYPDTEQVMGWNISEKGFQVMLSPDVPKVVKENLGRDVDSFLSQHNMTRGDVHSWIMHPGGPKILEAVSEALGLHDGELSMSWKALQQVGNLSSASVLVVLDQVMTQHRPLPGSRSVLAAMGPGFGSEMLLLEW
jgi:alkylresorcinol/alkylpyrone synthase